MDGRVRIGSAVAVVAVALVVAAARGASAREGLDGPRVDVVERPTARGALSHRLARPVASVMFSELPPSRILARLAWRFDVPLVIERRAVGAFDERGECSLDVRGADARETLLLAADLAGLRLAEDGERVVLHRAGDAWDGGQPTVVIAPLADAGGNDARVTGRVVDAGGRAVAGALVAGHRRPPTVSDADGRFACRVAPGDGRVVAWMAGRAPSAPTAAMRAGSDELLELTIGEPVATLVVRAAGSETEELVSDALARVTGLGEPRCTGATSQDGSVAVQLERAGRATVLISGNGHGAARFGVPVRLGTTTVARITLPAMSLATRLHDERVTFDVRAATFAAAVWRLSRQTVLPVRFARSLSGATCKRRVSFTGTPQQPLGTVLRTLCKAAGATARIDEEAGVVWLEQR